jgi:hypothetical protein
MGSASLMTRCTTLAGLPEGPRAAALREPDTAGTRSDADRECCIEAEAAARSNQRRCRGSREGSSDAPRLAAS